MKKLVIFLLIAILTLGACMPALAATTPTSKKVLLWSIDCPSGVYGDEKIPQSVVAAFEANGVTVTDQSKNTQHFAEGTNLVADYGLVFLMFPTTELNSTDISVLKKFVDAGGRIVMQGENPGWLPEANEVLSKAAADLGTAFTITTDPDGEHAAALNPKSNIISNPGHVVEALRPIAISRIDFAEPALLVAETLTNGKAFVVDQAVSKGRITVMSDVNFYTYDYVNRNTIDDPNVINFFYNLLADSVKNMDDVKAGKDPNSRLGEDPVEEPVPKTGDTTNVVLLGMVMLICAVGMTLTARKCRG